MNELAPSAFWFTFDIYVYWPGVRSRWLDIGRVLFFFFFFFAFLWTVTSQSSEKRKKRNDANIQLSWPNEQYEFDIIRIKNDLFILRNGKEIEV